MTPSELSLLDPEERRLWEINKDDPYSHTRALLSKVVRLRQYVQSLPANWHEDSSLETWFPLSAEELKRLKLEKGSALKRVGELEEALRGMLELTNQDNEDAMILTRADRKPITNGHQSVIDKAFIKADAALKGESHG